MPILRDDPNQDRVDMVFRTIVNKWRELVRVAKEHKQKVFGAAAQEIMSFYEGPRDGTWYELMTGGFGGDSDTPAPTFTVSVNKAFEYVQIFGPALYYEHPVRTVKPRMPVDVPPEFLAMAGMDQATYMSVMSQEQARVMTDGLRATLLGAYLNWTPHEFSLGSQSRQAIEEALIKGRSCLWTEVYTPPGSGYRVIRSRFDSVDNLLVDPDASSMEEALWIAMRCVRPTWEVEREYGIRAGTLRPNAESLAIQGISDRDEHMRSERSKGQSNDLLVYWKIWSKMGMGGRIPGVHPDYAEALEIFGDYCHLVVADGVNYPLNLPPSVMADPAFGADRKAILSRVEWPTPHWAAGDWPVSVIDFVKVPKSPWPMSPLKAGLPELRFLNWAHSFLCGHIHTTSRDFLVILKSLPEDVKTQLLGGKDLEMIEINSSENRPLSDLVQFLQHPTMNKDILLVIEVVEQNFDKRVGLTELMYGLSGVQMRSAEEAAVKQQNMSVRPEDMAKQVETWQARVAAKEAMAARFHLGDGDVRPMLGPIGAWAWTSYVITSDPHVAARQLEYHIEAGSTQKPNKDFEVRQMDQAFQSLGPVFQTYAQTTGDMTPLNNLLSDYAKSRDLDPARYRLHLSVPPPPPDQLGGGPSASQQEPTDNPVPRG